MIMETWILREGGLSQFSMLRLLRLLRISRVFRMVPELGMMVKSMVAAARSVSSTLVLAVGIMYVFSIILTQWAKSDRARLERCVGEICFGEMFGTIPRSMLTLMQVLVFDDTFSLIRACMTEALAIGYLLIFFILV